MNFKFPSSLEEDHHHNHNHYYHHPTTIPDFNRNSTFSFFTQQAIQAGYTSVDVRRREFEYRRNPVDIRGSVQREIEKERIRAEIIAEEVMRRRVLEEEVRREMRMERDMALRRGIGGAPGTMQQLERPRVPLLTNFEHGRGVEGLPQEVGFRGDFEKVPFQRDPVVSGSGSGNGVTLHEIEGVLASPKDSKDKVIILAKPSTNLADIKRKAMMPPGGSVIEVCKKQKSKEDWSCALCRITATSERGLNEHLLGKKHKIRERGMFSQRTGFGTGPLPKISSNNASKSIKNSKKIDKAEGESSLVNHDNSQSPNPSLLKDKHTLLKLETASVDKKENGVAIAAASDKPKKKFPYFCEMCQVGAFALKVFNTHKRGKKHLAKLGALKKTDDAAPVEASVQKTVMKGNKEAEMTAEEIKEGTEGEQIATNKDSDDTDVIKVDNKEKVLEMIDAESVAPNTTPEESVCNKVDC